MFVSKDTNLLIISCWDSFSMLLQILAKYMQMFLCSWILVSSSISWTAYWFIKGKRVYLISLLEPFFLTSKEALKSFSAYITHPSFYRALRSSSVHPPGNNPIKQKSLIACGSYSVMCWMLVSNETFKEAKGVPSMPSICNHSMMSGLFNNV